jgi:MurNAc alpha-1-phosphate uridylyltransferase
MTRAPKSRHGAGRGPRHPHAPLTDDRPKALVEVGGKALIDHMLDRLAAAGVETAVVNVHYFADRLEAHLAARRDPSPAPHRHLRRAPPGPGDRRRRQARPAAAGRRPDLGGQYRLRLDRGRARPSTRWPAPGIRTRMDVCLMLASTTESLGFHDTGDVFLERTGSCGSRRPARPRRWSMSASTSASPRWSPTVRTGRSR